MPHQEFVWDFGERSPKNLLNKNGPHDYITKELHYYSGYPDQSTGSHAMNKSGAWVVLTHFYQCLRLCSCGTKPQRSENHHFVMRSSWEPQCHHDIIMRTPRIMGKPKFSWSGGP